MNYARYLVIPTVLVILVLCGCGSSREQASEQGDATVEVINRNWLSMEVHVVGQSRRVRLGRVASGKMRRFSIPSSLLSGATPLRFFMESNSPGGNVISEEFVVAPGEDVVLVIPNMR